MKESFDLDSHRQYTYHFYFHDGLFEYLKQIEDYVAAIEEFLKSSLEKARQEDDMQGYDPRFTPDIQYGALFPDMLWNTVFLHCYFFAEASLNQICDNVKLAEDYTIGLQEIKGSGIQRAGLYLSKVAGVKRPFETEAWQKLNDLRSIRNILTHAEGYVDPANKQVIEYAKKYPGFSVVDFSYDPRCIQIGISKEFVQEAILIIETFFRDVALWLGTAIKKNKSDE